MIVTMHNIKLPIKAELFLEKYFGNSDFSFSKIPGDASRREYYRILFDSKTYILMYCPLDYTSLEPFIMIAKYLLSKNISVPRIFAKDNSLGLLLIEDFGSISLKKYIQDLEDHNQIYDTYKLIIDILIELHNSVSVSDIIIHTKQQGEQIEDELYHNTNKLMIHEYNNKLLLEELNLFTDYYIPYISGESNIQDHIKLEFLDQWTKILEQRPLFKKTLVLRDFHLENMLYLGDSAGIKSIGLIDFQDAVYGSPIYDIVSVLEDARIDVNGSMALKLLRYYAQRMSLDLEDVLLDYHILGAQRNSRILGVFVRKYVRDQDNRYLSYLTLVENYLRHDLSLGALSSLKNCYTRICSNM